MIRIFKGNSNYRLLEVLAEDGGFLTRDVSMRAGRGSGRRDSALTREVLLSLASHGLVAPMDDRKPVAWVRTKAGTEALERAYGEPIPLVPKVEGE